ncbi:MAG TPA: hypothetical protein VFH53_03995 [Phycisphaerae bacterium]|nr:hypothetical protein [Phycisphaerae bacterium]
MRQKGSILVVVLGLLAILAVIGVAFLTMSNLERSTATSFAHQTQMMIAADGALDYAIHQMVTDVWEWDVTGTAEAPAFSFTGNLLTGRVASGNPTTPPYSAACETYDYPSAATDPWLSAPITGNTTPDNISFAGAVVQRFGVNFGGTAAAVDNLGMPVAAPAKNGIWIPDLAAPCDQYLVRASVTILDHGALVNMNAHGSKNTAEWEYSDCIGNGYFVSDVIPPVSDLDALLFGTGEVPGCWGSNGPGNPETGAVLIENPAAGNDVPYTLDEEFELRNLWGTYFQSRLEQFWPTLISDPSNVSGYAQRLKTTTVSWTAEVRGDPADSHAIMKDPLGGDLGWSTAKVDLNTASPDDIYFALRDGRVMDDGDELKQFVANLVTFRRKANYPIRNITLVTIDGTTYVGAVRQPVLSEATCAGPVRDEIDTDDDGVVDDITNTYTIKIEVYNPWPGDADGDPDLLLRTDMRVTFDVNANPGGTAHQVLKAGVSDIDENLYNSTPGDACCTVGTATGVKYVERQVVCHNNLTLRDALKSIRLHWGTIWQGKVLNLDLINNTNVATLETSGRIYRKVDFVDERRSSKTTDNALIRVFYVSDWNSSAISEANLGTATKDAGLRSSAIPIRFPNCVSATPPTPLPVRAAAGADFKAFARVGDLDLVLRFPPGQDTWWSEPWICTVSRTTLSQESNIKFDWMKDIDNVAADTGTAAAYAANVLSVGGPWNDGLDNDGDAETDFADTGQTGGPEFRVAGKINLNTAITETLTALASGVGAPGLSSLTANRPFKSPAQILKYLNPSANEGVEQRDAAFTLISNIATVRSDTFSVYGTVQIVDPTTQSGGVIPDTGIVRSRRFWALVDRSPSLAYPPGSASYIRPRILNFQWLD